jgi:hypothetical protein
MPPRAAMALQAGISAATVLPDADSVLGQRRGSTSRRRYHLYGEFTGEQVRSDGLDPSEFYWRPALHLAMIVAMVR